MTLLRIVFCLVLPLKFDSCISVAKNLYVPLSDPHQFDGVISWLHVINLLQIE